MRLRPMGVAAAMLGMAIFPPGCSEPKDGPQTKAAIPAPEQENRPVIVDRPISFGKLRQDLTLDYIRAHYDPAASSITIVPRIIVIHWTASSTLKSAFSTFDRERLPLWRYEIRRGGAVNVSSHFAVDRDGTIYRLMPETWMARHTIGLNRIAIGIENVGGPKLPLTAQQVAADAVLVRDLVARHRTIRYLIGHHEYLRFRGTPLWQERDSSYETGKQDPGDRFMEDLRARVADLRLGHTWSPENPDGSPPEPHSPR
jgi:N-acetylmuramoyl-L-alanine amidase